MRAVLLLPLVLAGCFSGGGARDGGDGDLFYGAFPARERLTIGAGAVGQTFESFPLLVSLAGDPGLAAWSSGDGHDLAFFDADGTQLAHEIERAGPEGALVAWVLVPVVADDRETVLYLAMGGTVGGAELDATVWGGYAGVWHFGVGAGAVSVPDSTTYGSDAAVTGTVELGVDGVIGAGAILTGDGRLTVGDPLDKHLDHQGGAAGFTVSMWARWNSPRPGRFQDFLHKGSSGTTQPGYALELADASDNLYACAVSPGVELKTCARASMPGDAWVHVASVVDAAGGRIVLYLDGVEANTQTLEAQDLSSPTSLAFGAKPDGSYGLDGAFDEIRIVPAARSAAWLGAEVANQRTPSTFVTVGSVELAGAPVPE